MAGEPSGIKNNINLHRKVLVIVGPTCSGKSTISIPIALELDGEIVSADSRQIYKYLDIGTAKPSNEDLKKVKHHFISELEPDEDFSAGEYSKRARERINNIFRRNKQPIVVGGSGLYIESLIDGIFESPPVDKDLRRSLYEKYHKEGIGPLFEYLKKIDPDSAQKMIPGNVRRIIRAIEVFEITGIPISQLQKKRKPADFIPVQVALEWKRDRLYERINKRVEWMIENGLIDEVKKITDLGYSPELNSLQTVGYKEVIDYINNRVGYDEMVDLIKRNTRRYAKRQLTWFRHDARIKWFEVGENEELSGIVKNILEYFKNT